MRDVHFYSLVTLSEVNKKISPLNVWKKSTQKIPKANTCEEICEANPPQKKRDKKKKQRKIEQVLFRFSLSGCRYHLCTLLWLFLN